MDPETSIPAVEAPSVEELQPFFASYEVQECIGGSGLGALYRCRQTMLGRPALLRVVPGPAREDPEFVEEFQGEAKAMGHLTHPNVIAVYDYGIANGMPFALTEGVEGEFLREAMKGAALEPGRAAEVAGKICDAVAVAHDAGLLHGNLTPGSILVTPAWEPKVGDFGFSHHVSGDPADEPYCAPEFLEYPDYAGRRADVYSIGAVLFEMLTGRVPDERPLVPSAYCDCDPAFDAIVQRATEESPYDRYEDAAEMSADLEQILKRLGSGRPVLAAPGAGATPGVPVPAMTTTSPRGGGFPWVVVLIAAGAVGAAGWMLVQALGPAGDEGADASGGGPSELVVGAPEPDRGQEPRAGAGRDGVAAAPGRRAEDGEAKPDDLAGLENDRDPGPSRTPGSSDEDPDPAPSVAGIAPSGPRAEPEPAEATPDLALVVDAPPTSRQSLLEFEAENPSLGPGEVLTVRWTARGENEKSGSFTGVSLYAGSFRQEDEIFFVGESNPREGPGTGFRTDQMLGNRTILSEDQRDRNNGSHLITATLIYDYDKNEVRLFGGDDSSPPNTFDLRFPKELLDPEGGPFAVDRVRIGGSVKMITYQDLRIHISANGTPSPARLPLEAEPTTFDHMAFLSRGRASLRSSASRSIGAHRIRIRENVDRFEEAVEQLMKARISDFSERRHMLAGLERLCERFSEKGGLPDDLPDHPDPVLADLSFSFVRVAVAHLRQQRTIVAEFGNGLTSSRSAYLRGLQNKAEALIEAGDRGGAQLLEREVELLDEHPLSFGRILLGEDLDPGNPTRYRSAPIPELGRTFAGSRVGTWEFRGAGDTGWKMVFRETGEARFQRPGFSVRRGTWSARGEVLTIKWNDSTVDLFTPTGPDTMTGRSIRNGAQTASGFRLHRVKGDE